jgi:peptide deformylase
VRDRNIVIYPDSMLTTPAMLVDDTIDVEDVVRSMLHVMNALGGIGIAAPQVGSPARIVAIHPSCAKTRRPMILINPVVAWSSDDVDVQEEGCLSIPGKMCKVSRSTGIIVSARSLSGMHITVNARHDPFLTRVLLHELDHLDGIVMLDRSQTV